MAIPPTQSSQPQRPRRSNLLRYIAIAILTLIVLTALTVLIIWLVVKPKKIVYTVEDASIHNFNLTNDNHLYADFDISIRSYNPNSRVSIYYDNVDVSVQYDGKELATNTVQPFFQPHKNVTHMDVKLASQSLTLYGSLPRDLRLEKSSGDVELDVWIKARIRFKVGHWKSGHRTMTIYCSPVLVHFSRSKRFERTYCDVDL